MSNYRKLVAGIVGISLILLKHFTGIELPGLGDAVIEVAMAIGTWVSVWALPNTASSSQQGQAPVGGFDGEAVNGGKRSPQ